MNTNMKSSEEAITEYENEADKFAIEAEEFKKSRKNKQLELDNLVKKNLH